MHISRNKDKHLPANKIGRLTVNSSYLSHWA